MYKTFLCATNDNNNNKKKREKKNFQSKFLFAPQNPLKYFQLASKLTKLKLWKFVIAYFTFLLLLLLLLCFV